MAQTVSQPAVYANGLTLQASHFQRGKHPDIFQ